MRTLVCRASGLCCWRVNCNFVLYIVLSGVVGAASVEHELRGLQAIERQVARSLKSYEATKGIPTQLG